MSEKNLSIGTVARLTNLSTHVIRAWERRYDLRLAQRDKSGRRTYSLSDVEHLRLLKNAVNEGVKISDAVTLSVHQLTRLLNSQNNRSASNASWIVYGPRLIHGLFNLKPTVSYQVADSLTDIQQCIAKCNEKVNVWIQLDDLNDSIEQFIYDLLLKYDDSLQLTLFSVSNHLKAVERLSSAELELIIKPISNELITKQIDKLNSKQRKAKHDNQMSITIDQLASLKTSLYCDCPKHVAELYRQAKAFAIYNKNCEKLSPKDIAIHHFVAEQLSIIEESLITIAEKMERLGDLDIEKTV